MTDTRIRFTSDKLELCDLLDDIHRGRIQLPEFQRNWVWDDDHVKGILTSISQSYPVGALMLLQTGNEGVRLKARPITGAPESTAPEQLILDGQQRLTALYQALMADGPVKTFDMRKKEIECYYYFDMRACLDSTADLEAAVRALGPDRKVRNFRNEVMEDYSTPEREYEGLFFPTRSLFQAAEWRRAFNEHWHHDPEMTQFVDHFEAHIVEPFKKYWLPVIKLDRETPKDAICQVFEKVNTGGVPLTVFELLTAMFAVDNFDLRKSWDITRERLNADPVVRRVENTGFLQAVTLIATHARSEEGSAVSCKRRDILRLEHKEYEEYAPVVEAGYLKAGKLLRSQYIFNDRDLPYRTQLTPFAAVLGLLGTRADREGVRRQLFQWYWCGVLGELYGSTVETRFARDLTDLRAWLEGGQTPMTVNDAYFLPSRLLTIRTRNSAAYKGIAALLMRDGGQDFQSGETVTTATYNEEAMDIHHIFPEAWCLAHGIPKTSYDSIVNKTVISARTNRMIGKKAPSDYLSRLEREAGISVERMDEILVSHAIDPALLRADNYEEFFAARQVAILNRIELAMGRPIARDQEVAV